MIDLECYECLSKRFGKCRFHGSLDRNSNTAELIYKYLIIIATVSISVLWIVQAMGSS